MFAKLALKEGEQTVDHTPYLSKNDIESIAAPILAQYKKQFVPQRHLCYHVNPMQLAEVLGVQVHFAYLSQDGSILGQAASAPLWTTIIDPAMGETYFFLDGKTILVDKRLLTNTTQLGRKNFTVAHELAHLILSWHYQAVYGLQCRIQSVFRTGAAANTASFDRQEWQADALAASLLLPEDALKDAMFVFGLGERMKVLSRKYSPFKYDRFCEMAHFLQVSKTALACRMEQLGLLERNYFIKEARQKRGVA